MHIYKCVVCGNDFALSLKAKENLGSDRSVFVHISDVPKHRVICDNCYQNNWKFTEHGVLMNETPVKKGKK